MHTATFSVVPEYPVQVGEPIEVFSQGTKRALLGARALVLIAALAALAYLMILIANDLSSFGAGSWLLESLLFGAAILITVAGYSKISTFLREWRDSAVAGVRGFAYHHGGQWQHMMYDEVAEIVMVKERAWSFTGGGGDEGAALLGLFDLLMMFLRGHRYQYSITSVSEDRITVTGTLSSADRLMEMIRERAFPTLLNRATQALDAGQSLSFGPISISKSTGLSCQYKHYPWENIQWIEVNKGDKHSVQVKPKKGGLFESVKVSEHDVPNVDVLLCVCARMMRCTWNKYDRRVEDRASPAI